MQQTFVRACLDRRLRLISEVVSLDRKAALMQSRCSTNTRTAAMNSGMVRESIAAVVMLATLGTTSAQEAAELAVTGPVLSNTGPDAAAYGAVEGFPLGTLRSAFKQGHGSRHSRSVE